MLMGFARYNGVNWDRAGGANAPISAQRHNAIRGWPGPHGDAFPCGSDRSLRDPKKRPQIFSAAAGSTRRRTTDASRTYWTAEASRTYRAADASRAFGAAHASRT